MTASKNNYSCDLVLLASEEKIDQLIAQAESSFKKSAKKIVSGLSSVLEIYNPKTYIKMGITTAVSVEAIKKHGLTKEAVKDIQDIDSLLNSPTKIIEQIDVEEKLNLLKELLGINYKIILFPFSDKNQINIEPLGELIEDGTFLRKLPSGRYTKLAIFEKILAKERYNAFKAIAFALGAKQVKVLNFEIKENAKTIKSENEKSGIAAQLGINITLVEGTMQAESFSATCEPNFPANFKIPSVYKYWAEQDQELELLISTRKNSGLKTIHTTLHFRESTQIFSQIVMKLANKGFDVGGTYRKSCESICTFQIEF